MRGIKRKWWTEINNRDPTLKDEALDLHRIEMDGWSMKCKQNAGTWKTSVFILQANFYIFFSNKYKFSTINAFFSKTIKEKFIVCFWIGHTIRFVKHPRSSSQLPCILFPAELELTALLAQRSLFKCWLAWNAIRVGGPPSLSRSLFVYTLTCRNVQWWMLTETVCDLSGKCKKKLVNVFVH